MKLKSFRIKNYKSVIDSGVCRLSENDNILILAGQNESGKSAILQALYDFEIGELRDDCVRDFEDSVKYPVIECVFTLEDGDKSNIVEELEEVEESNIEKKILDVFLFELKDLSEITLIRSFENYKDSRLDFDIPLIDSMQKKIDNLIEDQEQSEEYENASEVEEAIEIDVSDSSSTLAKKIHLYAPKMIFFDDFCDLLPDRIYISDLIEPNEDAKGYSAVRNVERILNENLGELDSLSDAASAARQDKISRSFTANFNERWNQKIYGNNEVELSIIYQQGGKDTKGAYLNFYVLTKEEEYLTPNKRSQGLKWFLSFYLQLTAESKITDDLVILFDEPGLFLHSKAQSDIKTLFKELAVKDQIIYSTHSPYLIDVKSLNRVRLILNLEAEGTKVEKITTQKTGGHLDAMKPIIDAIGLEIAHMFSPVSNKNIILEGIADYNYFMGMGKILSFEEDVAFVPSMGATNVHLLMELCIGWGLDWLIIFDDGSQSRAALKKIKKLFFYDEEDDIEKKIYILKDSEGIEELFTASDLKLVRPDADFPQAIKKSDKVKEYGGKEIFSRSFLEKANNGEITKTDMSPTTIKRFEKIFQFIKENS